MFKVKTMTSKIYLFLVKSAGRRSVSCQRRKTLKRKKYLQRRENVELQSGGQSRREQVEEDVLLESLREGPPQSRIDYIFNVSIQGVALVAFNFKFYMERYS